MTKERLGRGLNALLGEYADDPKPEEAAQPTSNVSVTHVVRNPNQPRRDFGQAELDELAGSIRTNGLLQPILVRPRPGGVFELVAGERRFRAVQSLGWTEVPAVIREVGDQELMVLALVENLQREALSPLEEAEGYRVLVDDHGLSQGQAAKAVGKSRSAVANTLRLLGLPASIRRLVESGDLSAGHARALLSVDDPTRAADLARAAVKEGWSVREIERQAKADKSPTPPKTAKPPTTRDMRTQALERSLEESLATRVTLTTRAGGKGVIAIPFANGEEFERLFETLTGTSATEALS